MKTMLASLLLILSFAAQAQNTKPVTLRSNLLDQLHSTHDQKDWFVTIDAAVQGVSADQANWNDGKGNHSVGQLAYHLWFWNRRELMKFKGEPEEKFSGKNDETFTNFDKKSWDDTVKNLDQVMKDLEKFVETADDATLQKWAPEIARLGTHNAYHLGQIVFVRREQGSWNPENGVK